MISTATRKGRNAKGLRERFMNFFMNLIPTDANLNQAQVRSIFRSKRGEFFESLALAFEDKISITAFFESTIANEKKYGSKRFAAAVDYLQKRYLAEGYSESAFADSLKGLIPESERVILMAAERSGSLLEELRFVANNIEKTEKIRAAAKDSIMNPSIALLVTLYTVWLYAVEFVPAIEMYVKEDAWHGMSLMMRYVSYFLVNYGLYTAVLLIASLMFLVKRLPVWVGEKRRYFDDHIFSMYRNYHGALFLLSLTSLERGGVSRGEALNQIAKNSTPYIKWHCRQILKRLSLYPDNQGVAFDTGILPRKTTIRLINAANSSNAVKTYNKIGLTIVDQTADDFAKKAIRIAQFVETASALLTLALGFAFNSLTGSIGGS